jgi:hypothetical protein
MRLRSRPLLLALPVVLLAGLLTATEAAAHPQIAQLVKIRAASHAGYDRVVWEFRGPLPERTLVQRGTRLVEDGSGRTVPIAGSTVLTVSMHGARAHDEETQQVTAPRLLVPGMTNVAEVKWAGDFEAVVSYGVGLVKDQRYRVFTLRNPSRVVLDVRTDYPTSLRRVHFQHEPNYVAGREPYTVATHRRVPAWTPAAGTLHHLFAGPTAAERSRGMAVVRSGATGFSHLSITNGVARVRLTGGCSSGGATYTIANQIMPTLKQFASVSYVKIYDPQGRTARPTGRVDSVPACLEP